jgi:hypothetical protein
MGYVESKLNFKGRYASRGAYNPRKSKARDYAGAMAPVWSKKTGVIVESGLCIETHEDNSERPMKQFASKSEKAWKQYHRRLTRFRGNGRVEKPDHRGYINHKSGRVANGQRAEWLDEAANWRQYFD